MESIRVIKDEGGPVRMKKVMRECSLFSSSLDFNQERLKAFYKN